MNVMVVEKVFKISKILARWVVKIPTRSLQALRARVSLKILRESYGLSEPHTSSGVRAAPPAEGDAGAEEGGLAQCRSGNGCTTFCAAPSQYVTVSWSQRIHGRLCTHGQLTGLLRDPYGIVTEPLRDLTGPYRILTGPYGILRDFTGLRAPIRTHLAGRVPRPAGRTACGGKS